MGGSSHHRPRSGRVASRLRDGRWIVEGRDRRGQGRRRRRSLPARYDRRRPGASIRERRSCRGIIGSVGPPLCRRPSPRALPGRGRGEGASKSRDATTNGAVRRRPPRRGSDPRGADGDEGGPRHVHGAVLERPESDRTARLPADQLREAESRDRATSGAHPPDAPPDPVHFHPSIFCLIRVYPCSSVAHSPRPRPRPRPRPPPRPRIHAARGGAVGHGAQ